MTFKTITLRTRRLVGASLTVLACLLAPSVSLAQLSRPGATNPLGSSQPQTLVLNDQLFYLRLPPLTMPPTGVPSYTTWNLNASGLLSTQVDYANVPNYATESHQYFTATGRVFEPDKDTVVVAQRDGNPPAGGNPILLRYMYFTDSCCPTMVATRSL